MSCLNIQFSTLVVLVSGVVHNLICLKVLAEITNVTFRSHGCGLPVCNWTDKWTYQGKISFFNAPQKE
jgi:hypothetical protein